MNQPATQRGVEPDGGSPAAPSPRARGLSGFMRRHRYDALGSLLAVVFSLPAWTYPFGNDQALHWYLGQHWLRGELPYVSGISSKPIGIFFLYALASWLFGPAAWAIRVIESISVVLFGWAASACSAPLRAARKDGELGAGALLFSGAYYLFFDYWDTAHPELWESGFVLCGLLVARRARAAWARDAGAGALCATGFMFKFPAALPSLAVAALCAARALRERPPARSPIAALFQAGARYLAGALLVFAICVLPYVWTSQLGPMWEVLHDFVRVYTEQAMPPGGVPGFLYFRRGGALLLIAAVLGLGGFLQARAARDREAIESCGWIALGWLMSAASVIAQGRYFAYHFVALAPFCVALCVFGMRQLPSLAPWPSARAWAVIGSGIAALLLIGPHWCTAPSYNYRRYIASLLSYERGEIDRDMYLQAFVGNSPYDRYWRMEHLAKHVQRRARSGDTLCVRGFLTPLYAITGLSCTSRHIVQDIVDTGLPQWPEEYARDLERRPPSFIVTFVDRSNDLHELKRRGYKAIALEDGLVLYARRSRIAAELAARGIRN
jgi:hypothetical protein